MNQNTNEIKWALTNPVKFMDKECGEVEVVANGTFAYQITNQELFSAAATQANMDEETYAKGMLLRVVVDEISKYSGKMVFGLSDLVKSENVLTIGNNVVAGAGLKFTNVKIENIDLTDSSKNKMKDIETAKIKSAITGREVVNNMANSSLEEAKENAVENNEKAEEILPQKNNGVLGILISAIVAAILMMFLFR